MDDQNIDIYAVSRTTPKYVVIGQNWNWSNWSLFIGQFKLSYFNLFGESVFHGNMVDRHLDSDRYFSLVVPPSVVP